MDDLRPEDLRTLRSRAWVFAPYLMVAVPYIGIGIFLPEVVLGWPLGVLLAFLGPWAFPALLRRLRR